MNHITDVGVRPAWEPAFEALGAVRQREQEAQDAQVKEVHPEI